MRTGSAIANGMRQYAAAVNNSAWQQLESSSGFAVAATGLAAQLPVARWKGQMGSGTNPYDYVQGLLIENLDATAVLYVTTTADADGSAPTSRLVAYATKVPALASLTLSNTDASKVYVQSSVASSLISVMAT